MTEASAYCRVSVCSPMANTRRGLVLSVTKLGNASIWRVLLLLPTTSEDNGNESSTRANAVWPTNNPSLHSAAGSSLKEAEQALQWLIAAVSTSDVQQVNKQTAR